MLMVKAVSSDLGEIGPAPLFTVPVPLALLLVPLLSSHAQPTMPLPLASWRARSKMRGIRFAESKVNSMDGLTHSDLSVTSPRNHLQTLRLGTLRFLTSKIIFSRLIILSEVLKRHCIFQAT